MVATVEPLASGFVLQDPEDPRHKYMTNLKNQFGALLYKASKSLRSQGEENIVDAIHMLVRILNCYVGLLLISASTDPFHPHVHARLWR